MRKKTIMLPALMWAATIQGTEGDDVLTGTESRDVIIPFGGNDVDDARGGNDTIYGGPGRDLIDCAYLETRSGDSEDTAYANRGEDTVVDCKTVIYPDPTSG
jgi:Ca2+-binding RTX toxin-like protein